MFTFSSIVRLPDTDAAGILFFGNYFRVAHDAYETLMTSMGLGFSHLLTEADFLIFIAHAEADYHQPLRLGEAITVELRVDEIKHSSFVLSFTIKDAQGQVAAKLRSVHVAVDKKSRCKVDLPESLREALTKVR